MLSGEYESMKRTIDVLSDKELMRQVRESETVPVMEGREEGAWSLELSPVFLPPLPHINTMSTLFCRRRLTLSQNFNSLMKQLFRVFWFCVHFDKIRIEEN